MTKQNTATQWPPETEIPDGEEPELCPYCSFPLPDEEQLVLHTGLRHYQECTENEKKDFKNAYLEEEKALNRFRIIALGGLVLLYFGFLIIYALLA